MDLLSPKRMACNAYRVLGLPTGSSQAQIEAAARRMRIWADPAQIPPTPWDAPSLGPVPRRRIDIEDAVSRLNEPRSRLEERLLSVSIEPLRFATSLMHPSIDPITMEHPCAAHDAALLDLLVAGPPGRHFAWAQRIGEAIHRALGGRRRYADALRRFMHAVNGNRYGAWVQSIELDGDFEKRAEASEIAQVLGGFTDSLHAALCSEACDALESNQFRRFDRVMALRKAVMGDAEPQSRYTREILDRMEDLLMSRARRIDAELRQAFARSRETSKIVLPLPKAARKYYLNAANQAERTMNPLLARLRSHARDEPHRLQRVGDMVGQMYINVGVARKWCNRSPAARRCYLRAIELTRNPSLVSTAKANLTNVGGPLGLRQKAWRWLVILGVFGLVWDALNFLFIQPQADVPHAGGSAICFLICYMAAYWIGRELFLIQPKVLRPPPVVVITTPARRRIKIACYMLMLILALVPFVGLTLSAIALLVVRRRYPRARKAIRDWFILSGISSGISALAHLNG